MVERFFFLFFYILHVPPFVSASYILPLLLENARAIGSLPLLPLLLQLLLLRSLPLPNKAVVSEARVLSEDLISEFVTSEGRRGDSGEGVGGQRQSLKERR